jgi:hypothetical protein
LSIIVPTISGREDSLARCLNAYKRGSPHDAEYIVVKDRANWPTACNEGFRQAKGNLLHFTSDDLEPFEEWWTEVLFHISEHDEFPAPKVFNHSADGEWDNAIGPWPEIDYGADVWLSERGRTLGIETRMFHSYAFVHHWNQVGRIDTPERLAESDRQLHALRVAGLK